MVMTIASYAYWLCQLSLLIHLYKFYDGDPISEASFQKFRNASHWSVVPKLEQNEPTIKH